MWKACFVILKFFEDIIVQTSFREQIPESKYFTSWKFEFQEKICWELFSNNQTLLKNLSFQEKIWISRKLITKKLNSNEKISVQNLCLGFPNSKWLQKVKENKVWIRDWKVWIQTVNSNGDSYVNNLEGGIVG